MNTSREMTRPHVGFGYAKNSDLKLFPVAESGSHGERLFALDTYQVSQIVRYRPVCPQIASGSGNGERKFPHIHSRTYAQGGRRMAM